AAHIATQEPAQRGPVNIELGKILAQARALQAQVVDVPELLEQLVDVVAGEYFLELADRDEDVFRLDELPFGGRGFHGSDLPRREHSRTGVCHSFSYIGESITVRKRITSPARSRPGLRTRSLLSSRIILHISPIPYFSLRYSRRNRLSGRCRAFPSMARRAAASPFWAGSRGRGPAADAASATP